MSTVPKYKSMNDAIIALATKPSMSGLQLAHLVETINNEMSELRTLIERLEMNAGISTKRSEKATKSWVTHHLCTSEVVVRSSSDLITLKTSSPFFRLIASDIRSPLDLMSEAPG